MQWDDDKDLARLLDVLTLCGVASAMAFNLVLLLRVTYG